MKPSRLQVWSAPVLLFIHGLPRFVFPLVITGLLVSGLLVQSGLIAGLLLFLVGLILLWLVALSWSLLSTGARVSRVALVLVVCGYAGGRMLGLIA